MNVQLVLCSFFSIVILEGCGGSNTPKNNIIYVPTAPPLPASPLQQKMKILKSSLNKDGNYSIITGVWTAPSDVYSVKIIGCSGGNGGGGGGSGGAGAGIFRGSWSGASLGGNGSAGGDANGVVGSGERGNPGRVGKLCPTNPQGPCHSYSASGGGYIPAISSSVDGANGKQGEQTFFGEFKFSHASSNLENINNSLSLSSILKDYKKYCLGGSGGEGGKGGIGANGNLQGEFSHGGFGGNGGHGKEGFSSLLEEKIISVQPGQTLTYSVGVGGHGGNRSHFVATGQIGNNSSDHGHDGYLGGNGAAGSPGVLILQWSSAE